MAIDTDSLPYAPEDAYDNGLIEVTQSAIGTYLTCKMKFVLAYLLRLRGGGVSVPLLVGSAVHVCFDFLLDPKSRKLKPADIIGNCQSLINGLFDAAMNSTDLACVSNPEKLEHGRAQAHAVVQAWIIVNSNWPERFQVVQTEQIIRAAPGAKKGDPLEDRAAGKIDGVVIDLEQKLPFILEHKTKYTLKDFNFMLGLDLNQQALFYASLYRVHLSRQTKQTEVTVKGKKIKMSQPTGLYYDAIAKPYHRSGATQDHLIERMVSAMVEDQEKYFCLTPIEMTPETVQHALNNFKRIVQEMDELTGPRVTFNWNACDMYNGCPYRSICKTLPDPSEPASILEIPEAQLYSVGNLHNELDVDPTEQEPF